MSISNPAEPRRADEVAALTDERLADELLGEEPTQILESAEAGQPAIQADKLGLAGPRGPIYRDVSLRTEPGAVTALVGPQGSGRTALLLTLSGRMAFSSGSLRVLGHELPKGRRDVQHHAALAHFDGIDELDEGLKLGELVQERAGLCVPLWRRPMRTGDPEMIELATMAFFPGLVPQWETPVWQLTPLQNFQARLLIAMIGKPRVMVVDNLDAIRELNDQVLAWTCIQRLAQRGVAIVASTTNDETIPADVAIVRVPMNTETEA